MWVLDYLDDLESDFSVFHRVEDMYSLPGPLFFSRAQRLTAYAGVMQARVEAMQESTRKRHGTTDVQEKTLDELARTRGGADLFDHEEV